MKRKKVPTRCQSHTGAFCPCECFPALTVQCTRSIFSEVQLMSTLTNTTHMVTLGWTPPPEIHLEMSFWDTSLGHTKRVAISSCFCFNYSGSIWKPIEPSPKEIRVHFILSSGCIMHVDEIILCRGTGKGNRALLLVRYNSAVVSTVGPLSSHQHSLPTPSPPNTSLLTG